ncbi:Uncharacterised protein [Mycobacteroides abscessus subsp. massiliense]|nr:Uncharacterised protein [Mycobacteroides abscessus subsp. massiliense]
MEPNDSGTSAGPESIARRAGTVVRHTLDLVCTLHDWITLSAVVGPAHDAVIEQLLGNLEHALTGTVKQPHRWIASNCQELWIVVSIGRSTSGG